MRTSRDGEENKDLRKFAGKTATGQTNDETRTTGSKLFWLYGGGESWIRSALSWALYQLLYEYGGRDSCFMF